MPRTRRIRALGHTVRVGIFALLVYLSSRYFVAVVTIQGWVPAAFFGLLLVTGSVSLVWRASLDLRKAVRKLRG